MNTKPTTVFLKSKLTRRKHSKLSPERNRSVIVNDASEYQNMKVHTEPPKTMALI